MNREQKHDRRKQMADDIAGGATTKEVAIKFKVTTGTVRVAAKENGIPIGSPKLTILSRSQWESLDWSRQDVRLAREIGVSRERVRQVRNALGKDKAVHHGERHGPDHHHHPL